MKIEFLKKISLFAVASASFALLNTGCTKVDDLYKSSGPDGEGLLNNVEVSSNFAWNTSKVIDVRLSVDDQFDGKYLYKLELFDREPSSADANLLGGGVAKKGLDLVTKISIPSGLSYIYVQETTPRGEKSYSMIEVTGKTSVNNSISAGLSKLAGISSQGVRKMASLEVQPEVEPVVPSDAKKISGSSVVTEQSKSYVIEAGDKYTGAIDLANSKTGIVLYIKGEWAPSSDVKVENNNEIVILSGGKLTLNTKSIEIKSDKPIVRNYGVLSAGSFTLDNSSKLFNYNLLKLTKDLTMPSTSNVYNYGELFSENIVVSSSGEVLNYKSGVLTVKKGEFTEKATFTNNGTALFTSLSATNSTNIITNNGVMRVTDNAKLTNAIFNVNCNTFVEKMYLYEAKVNIATGARLDVVNLSNPSGRFDIVLSNGAMLDVTGKADFDGYHAKVIAKDGIALARFKQLNFNKWQSVIFTGKLTVAADKNETHAPNLYIVESNTGAKMVKYNEITITISGTECNGGGINYTPTNPPVDQKPEPIELGTYSYAFEDNWPTKGDYDFNDLVVDVQIVKYQNKDNKVEKLVLKNKIRAVGASKRLAAAIQLDNVLAGAVKSVTYSKKDLVGKVLSLNGVGVENGQSKAVLTIVDDAHSAFGRTDNSFIYTHNGVIDPLVTEITVEFNTPLESFTYEDLNPFIVNFAQNAGGRNEVHMVGYKATDKINKSLLAKEQGESGSLSKNDPYKNKQNYPFALRFPIAFQYPSEAQSIDKAYPLFEDWVISNGESNKFWYDRTK